MPIISIIFRALIIAPIRAFFDVIKWIFTTIVPFIGTILGSTPLNIIFLISIAIMILMWLFPDVVVWLMVLIWEISRFFFNIYLLAWNIINTLFYNWFTPLYNDIAEFVLLIWKMVNNGICDGMPPFANDVDCWKFADWLTIIEIWITFTYEYLYIGMGFLALLAQLLTNLLGNLDAFTLQEHNYCTMPACSDWGKMRIDPDTGIIIQNPGLIGVNFKDNLSEEDVRIAQIIASIIIFFIQWFLSELLPFLVQFSAWATDVARLIIYYLWEILEILITAIANLLGAAFYVIARAYINILNQPDLTIVFDPDFWSTNITAYSNENQQEIIDAFVEEYMFNITDLIQYRTIGIGRNETWQGLINSYYYIHISLQMVFELPLMFSQLADKALCIFLHLFSCLNLSFFCDFLFNPPTDCLGVQKIATNNNLFNMTPDPWYYNYRNPEYVDINALSYCSNFGCTQYYCPENATEECKNYANNNFFCIGVLNIEPITFRCLDEEESGWVGIGPILPFNEAVCIWSPPFAVAAENCFISPYNPEPAPNLVIPLGIFGGPVGSSITFDDQGCNITDVVGSNNSCRYCGHVFEIKGSGILYPDKKRWLQLGLEWIVSIIDDIGYFLGENIWGALTEFGYEIRGLCIDLNAAIIGSEICPCCGCPTEDGQIIKVLDEVLFKWFTCEGFPCNPSATPSCCTYPPPKEPGDPTAPYYSLLYTIRGIINSFDIFNVLPDLF